MASRIQPSDISNDPGQAGGGPGARHVAIIMDGNGRWAKQRGLPRVAGHKAGVEAVRKVCRTARDLGLECLTLYAFSSENWKRPASEISDLMGLLSRFIRSDIDEFDANDVRLKVVGNYGAFDASVVKLIDNAVARTTENRGSTVAIALNYGSQDELARAARLLAAQAVAGEIAVDDINSRSIEPLLDTHGLPPLDLLIRTSGEQRLSNFLLWQVAYAELYFTDRLWPDFDGAALAEALDAFRLRERRYGGL